MTSLWPRWRLKSSASQLFTQPFFSDADQRKHQSSASLALCVGNSPWPVNSPHKGPVTRKMFPFDDVIMVNMCQNMCRFDARFFRCVKITWPCGEGHGLEFGIKFVPSWQSDEWITLKWNTMMMPSNGDIFRVTGHLCGKFTGHRWIPRTKASDAELLYFLWSAP